MISRATICCVAFALATASHNHTHNDTHNDTDECFGDDCDLRVPVNWSQCSEIGKDCKESRCCKDRKIKCYEKNSGYAICRVNCTPGVDKNDDPKWATPWSCNVLDASIPTTTVTTTTPEPLPSPNCTGEFDLDGINNKVYIGGGGVNASGDTLDLQHPAFFELLHECPPNNTNWTGKEFQKFKLLGKNLTYTVELSKAGCACNFAVYLIAMPARKEDGSPDPGQWGDYYCDAAGVGGHFCPEIDIMEANNHVFQTTPHSCDPPVKGHYDKCDRDGCMLNTRDMPTAYGPGPNYTINTMHAFTVNSAFIEKDGKLVNMVTTLQQGDQQVVLDQINTSCNGEYLDKMTAVLKAGMTMRITYWGEKASGMAWMDSPPCGDQTCTGDHAGNIMISGFTVLDPDAPSKTTNKESKASEKTDKKSKANKTTTKSNVTKTTKTKTKASSTDAVVKLVDDSATAAKAEAAIATPATSPWVPIKMVALPILAIAVVMISYLWKSNWRHYLRLPQNAARVVMPLNE